MNVYIKYRMIYYDIIDVSEGVDVNRTSASKECDDFEDFDEEDFDKKVSDEEDSKKIKYYLKHKKIDLFEDSRTISLVSKINP